MLVGECAHCCAGVPPPRTKTRLRIEDGDTATGAPAGSRGEGTGYSSDGLTHFYNILTPRTNSQIRHPLASFRAVNSSIIQPVTVAGFSFIDIYYLSTFLHVLINVIEIWISIML